MSKEAMKLALEALKEGDWYIGQLETIVYSSDDDVTHGNRAKVQEAIKALEEALAKQEQGEPVARLKLMMEESAFEGRLELSDALLNIDEFYTAPQPKQEQGEPVAYLVKHFQGDEQVLKANSDVMPVFFKSPEHFTCEPLYTTPRKCNDKG